MEEFTRSFGLAASLIEGGTGYDKRICSNLEQKTRPWFLWRADGVGGSDVCPIYAPDIWPFKDTNRQSIFESKTTRVGWETPPTYQMYRGISNETVVRFHFEQEWETEIHPVCCFDPNRPYIRGSLDGVFERDGEIALFEIKCPNWESHQLALIGQVPDYYYPQIQWQMAAANIHTCYYASWSDNKKKFPSERDRFAIVRVQFDPIVFELINKACLEFWNEVLKWKKENQ